MKAILKLLFFLLFLMLAIIIFGLFLPREYTVTREKDIEAPVNIIFEQVNNFEHWYNWAPWMFKDKGMVVSRGGISIGIGAEISWQSEVFGNCKAKITNSNPSENIDVNFDYGTISKNSTSWSFKPTEEGTLVNWAMKISKLSLWERYFLLFHKNDMQALIETGIHQLDSVSRQLVKSRIGDIQVLELTSQPSIVMIDSVKPENINVRRIQLYEYLQKFIDKRSLKVTGNPFLINYGQVNDTLVKIAIGLPVSERTWVWQTLKYLELPKTKAVSVSHFGYPADKAHRVIMKHIEKNNLETNGVPWEVFIYNLKNNTDTANWETKVYYPVK